MRLWLPGRRRRFRGRPEKGPRRRHLPGPAEKATASRQLSQESPDWGHGAFTKALVDALTAANQEQRRLTSTDLERYLYDTVSDMTGQAQTPTVAKAGLPDFVLVPGSR